MKNIVKGAVALVGLVAGLGFLGLAFERPARASYEDVDRAVTLSGDGGETMVATQTGNVIELPEMVIGAAPHRKMRHDRSAPTGRQLRTFVHELAQGGAPVATTVVVHDYE